MIDIAPTVLDVAGIPPPERVNGAEQIPIHGVSMRYAFDDAGAPDRHTTQYFEIGGNRGICHAGWTAVTKHATPCTHRATGPRRTVPLVLSLDESCDVGDDAGLTVSDDYRAEDSEFTGTVASVPIELSEGADDLSHLIDPQLRLSVAMARQ